MSKPLTYEMAYKPSDIAHKKGWNSWNTSKIFIIQSIHIMIDNLNLIFLFTLSVVSQQLWLFNGQAKDSADSIIFSPN